MSSPEWRLPEWHAAHPVERSRRRDHSLGFTWRKITSQLRSSGKRSATWETGAPLQRVVLRPPTWSRIASRGVSVWKPSIRRDFIPQGVPPRQHQEAFRPLGCRERELVVVCRVTSLGCHPWRRSTCETRHPLRPRASATSWRGTSTSRPRPKGQC